MTKMAVTPIYVNLLPGLAFGGQQPEFLIERLCGCIKLGTKLTAMPITVKSKTTPFLWKQSANDPRSM